MKWPTWEQSAIAAAISALVVLALRRWPPKRYHFVEPAAVEFGLIAALYSIWRVARKLPLAQNEGAIERARQIVDVQEALLLPSELTVQQFVMRWDWLGWLSSHYYAILHVPALLVFLVWLFVRQREHFPHWRNGLVFLTGACLVIRYFRVAPPRFLVDLGYVDLSEVYGPSIYGPVGTGVSDQFAAMPSIHVGWAAVVSFGVFATTTSRWRWVVMLHVVITALVVSATGHHWWLDGIVALGLLAIGLRLDTAVRRWRAGRAAGRSPDVPSDTVTQPVVATAATPDDRGQPVGPSITS